MSKRKFWTALKTKQASSADAIVNVRNQGFEYFHPLYRQSPTRNVRKIVPLFPYYLIVQVDTKLQDWRVLSNTKGVQNILMAGLTPGRIPDPIVKELRSLCDDTEDGYYHDPKTEPPKFEPGISVVGLRGLFAEKFGTYKGRASTGASRVRVLFDILGRETEFEMSAYDLATAA